MGKLEKHRRTTESKSRPTRKRPPNYFSRREQYRLFILCAMLMLVLVMMNEARKPATWKWMWGDTPAAQKEGSIETRVDAPVRNLPEDGFTVRAKPNDANSTQAPRPFLPGITAEMLSEVEDNAVLRVRENPAWLAMFRILGEKSQAKIESLSTASVGFAQLFRQTEIYRGRLVTVAGTARRLEEVQPRSNSAGIEQLFRWIVEPAGGSNSPIVVYSLEKPAQLDVGDLREDCEITGFCFKRWAYAAGDGTRIAPLLLAKNITWSPPPPADPVRLPSTPIMAFMMLGLLAVSVGVAVAVYRSSVIQNAKIVELRESAAKPAMDLDDEQILPDVGHTLRNLAEKDL